MLLSFDTIKLAEFPYPEENNCSYIDKCVFTSVFATVSFRDLIFPSETQTQTSFWAIDYKTEEEEYTR